MDGDFTMGSAGKNEAKFWKKFQGFDEKFENLLRIAGRNVRTGVHKWL